MKELIPLTTANIGDQETQTVNARDLHTFLDVGRDFTTWIKARVGQYGFEEGIDYCTIYRSPKRGSGNRGASTDYHLTLDMAKELAMVENNEKGRQARRYFIECERRLHEQQTEAPVSTPEPAPRAIRTVYDLGYVRQHPNARTGGMMLHWWSFDRPGGESNWAGAGTLELGREFFRQTVELAQRNPKEAEQAMKYALLRIIGGSHENIGLRFTELAFCEGIARAAVQSMKEPGFQAVPMLPNKAPRGRKALAVRSGAR